MKQQQSVFAFTQVSGLVSGKFLRYKEEKCVINQENGRPIRLIGLWCRRYNSFANNQQNKCIVVTLKNNKSDQYSPRRL